jgi:hypothetical protein
MKYIISAIITLLISSISYNQTVSNDNFNPTYVFIQSKDDLTQGYWWGKIKFYQGEDGLARFQRPDPKKDKIVIIIRDSKYLPKEFKGNSAYIWNGGNKYKYFKNINGSLDDIKLLAFVGMKHLDKVDNWPFESPLVSGKYYEKIIAKKNEIKQKEIEEDDRIRQENELKMIEPSWFESTLFKNRYKYYQEYLNKFSKSRYRDSVALLSSNYNIELFDHETMLTYEDLKEKYNWDGNKKIEADNDKKTDGDFIYSYWFLGNLEIDGGISMGSLGINISKGTNLIYLRK